MRRFLVAVVGVAVLAACGGDDTSVEPTDTSAPTGADAEILLDVVDDALVGGVREESVSLGDEVRIVVTGDSTDQVHVHGYDRYIDLDGGEGELTFTALIPGIFEVELEELGRLLIRLEVS